MIIGLLLVLAQIFTPVPEKVEALRFGAELPAFEVKDVLGKTWRSEDLRGKHTLVLLWHTFAARHEDGADPWIREFLRVRGMPDLGEVEEVHQKARKSPGIQVLTFSTDYDYTHAGEYMKERQYSFPVIADWQLTRKLFGQGTTALVVNPEGRVSESPRSWSFTRLLWETQKLVTASAR
jgi:peroxiredoxin